MLTSPHKSDYSFIEGTVTAVDPIRFICAVKTLNGRTFTGVRWLLPTGGTGNTGMNTLPALLDRVVISTALGYPFILGCLPSIDSPDAGADNITGSLDSPDVGTDTAFRGVIVANPAKPVDLFPTDFTYTAKGGAQISILSGGIAIIKASTLAQIVMSKFEGLIRIVTRNYQRFSDASSRVSVNMKGRLYEYFAVDTKLINNRNGTERYQEFYGDVAAAEVLQASPNNVTTLPVADARVRKISIKDASGNIIMNETLSSDGNITITIPDFIINGVSITKGTTGLATSATGDVLVIQNGIVTSQGAEPFNTAFLTNMTASINQATSQVELQALVDKSFGQLGKVKLSLQNKVIKMNTYAGLALPPTDPIYIAASVVHYNDTILAPITQMGTMVTAITNAVPALTAAANAKAAQLAATITIPTV
jgi:hypothetical protein